MLVLWTLMCGGVPVVSSGFRLLAEGLYPPRGAARDCLKKWIAKADESSSQRLRWFWWFVSRESGGG